jgi:hypothetical protein
MSVSKSDFTDFFSSPTVMHRYNLVVSASSAQVRIEVKLIALSCFFLHIYYYDKWKIVTLQLFLYAKREARRSSSFKSSGVKKWELGSPGMSTPSMPSLQPF